MPEENRAIQRRLVDEIFNRHDPEAVERYFAPHYLEPVPLLGQEPGLEGFKRLLARTFSAFPDQHWTVEYRIAEGDKVLTHFTWRATHRGEFMGMPPTNRPVKVWGIALDRMADGKVVESRVILDYMGMLQQMGAVSPPGQETKCERANELRRLATDKRRRYGLGQG